VPSSGRRPVGATGRVGFGAAALRALIPRRQIGWMVRSECAPYGGAGIVAVRSECAPYLCVASTLCLGGMLL